MVKCANCGRKLSFFKCSVTVGSKNFCSEECVNEERRRILEELMNNPNVIKIKCPYCEKWFPRATKEQFRDSALDNSLKWLIVPAWGLAGSIKNKPYVECPFCKMKIMQG